ncbi:Uncharacterised protein [Escherichia coli]|uniref:Uncharacterized protein n=1 Tax=Escherichia coli TaxID=562 RepID=A0A377E4Y4_ECOLX|nr:Uncharacterised protein [Escherichia coli]
MKLIAVRSDGAVVVKAPGQLRVTANHMRWFRANAGNRVMNARRACQLLPNQDYS